MVDYTPHLRENVYNINEFYFTIRPNDTFLVMSLIGTRLVNKQNKFINAVGKMMVVNTTININLANLLFNLGNLAITSTIIYSINLRDDFKEEVFRIKSGNLSIVYVEIGICHFMVILNSDPLRHSIFNKRSLYILRNGYYFDIKYLLSYIGEGGINLGRGGNQRAHVMSTLVLRFTAYLMAMCGFNYRRILELNTFDTLPKFRYLPFLGKP